MIQVIVCTLINIGTRMDEICIYGKKKNISEKMNLVMPNFHSQKAGSFEIYNR